MNYLSLHGRLASVLGLGLLALAAGCASNDDRASEASSELGTQQLYFRSSTLVPDAGFNFTVSRDGAMYASYIKDNALVVAVSTDHGQSWKPLHAFESVGAGAKIIAAPSNAKVLYLTRAGYYSWGGAPSAAVNPGDDEGILLRSEDGGMTWSDLTARLPASPLARGFSDLDVNPTNDQHLVTANCDGVQKSVDGGKTWRVLPGSKQTYGDCNRSRLYRGISDRTTLYTLSSVGEGGGSAIMRSFDDGATWQGVDASSDGPGYLVGVRGLVVHPDDARHLYLTDMNGFYSSGDGGDRFYQHVRTGPQTTFEGYTTNVAVNPNGGALYIASKDTIYRWVPVAGEAQNGHWTSIGQLPGAIFTDPKIVDNILYVTTDTQIVMANL